MKRFWLFGGNDFYADGGFCDFQGCFDTLKEAVEKGAATDWYHVFDSHLHTIVDFQEGCYSGELECLADRNPEFGIVYEEAG